MNVTRPSRRSSLSGGMELFLRQASFRCNRRASMGGGAGVPRPGVKRSISRSNSCRSIDSTYSKDSFISTISTHTIDKKSSLKAPKKAKKNHYRVSICEQENEYFEAKRKHAGYANVRWYSKKDIQGFRKDNALKLSKLVRDPKTSQGAVLKGFLQTYQKLSSTKSSDDVEKIFSTCRIVSYDADLAGLEGFILKTIEQDKKVRREKVMRVIHQVQDSGCSNEVASRKKIFKAARSASRPSRLFAHYVGIMSFHNSTATESSSVARNARAA